MPAILFQPDAVITTASGITMYTWVPLCYPNAQQACQLCPLKQVANLQYIVVQSLCHAFTVK